MSHQTGSQSGGAWVSPASGTAAYLTLGGGQTPALRTSISHHSRINVIGGLLISPHRRRIRLLTRLHRQNIASTHVIAFLRVLLGSVRGPIVLMWDNPPIHRHKQVAAFIAKHPRLHVYTFPRYAPELNPAEGIWTQSSEYIAGSAPRHVDELRCNVRGSLRRTGRSDARLWACVHMSDLPCER